MKKLLCIAISGLLLANSLSAVPLTAAENQTSKTSAVSGQNTAVQNGASTAENPRGTTTVKKKKKQKTIFIAAGHQERGISSRERLAPGSSATKAKLTSGTTGVRTGIPEYKTNLAIAKATRKALRKAGYKVIMLRTTNKCPLSNQQRTKKANKSGADLHICIHCNAAGSSAKGPLVCVPASSKYVGKKIYNKSCRLGSCLLSSVAKATGKKSHGTIRSNYYTTINWAKIPTVILECGFLTNPTEDRQLNSAKYQKKIAKGIVKGVNRYFKNKK